MLLFGGNLSGAAKKEASGSPFFPQENGTPGKKKESPREGHEASLSPRTDVLHRLTNHELRLLEELERTRATLQAEWRHKVASIQKQQQSNRNDADGASSTATTIANLEHLAQQLGLPSPTKTPEAKGDLKAMMRSKTLVRHPNQSSSSKPVLKSKKSRSAYTPNLIVDTPTDSRNLPVLRSSLDILPILTTTGETPFEIGLDSASPAKQQHVLPIFRLPTVNVTTIASAIAAKEVEVVEEDRERKQASEALGLSLEEIAMLEAELAGDSADFCGQRQTSEQHRLEKKLPDLGRPREPKVSRALQRRDQRRKQAKRASWATKDCRTDQSDHLRKELESALTNVQHLTRLVKDDIVFAQKICPSNELRTSLYFKRWGRDKVENIFRRLLFNLQGIAFQKWARVIAHEKQEEKLQAYLMYKGSKKLDQFLLNWSQRKLHQAWTKWWSDVAHTKAIERLALELDSIRVLQRAWRGYRGRVFASLVKAQKLFAQQSAAAAKIQRMFRGSVTRKFFRLKRLNKRRQDAATTIQACGKGYLVRQHVKSTKLAQKSFVAASKIQALYRGRKTRREIAVMRRNRRVTQAALIIQRRYRGRLGRVKFIRRQIERYRDAAATKIQRIARRRIARRIVRDRRAKAAQRKALEHASAIKIQKVYRGHRSRLSTELKLLALREKNRWRAKAATKIQKIMRSFLAKKLVRRLWHEREVELVRLARTWVEYWNEDTSSWFYYKQEVCFDELNCGAYMLETDFHLSRDDLQTGEAIWAPPPSGYTKADGNLVLQTGQIIPDPADAEIDESDDEDKLCVECEEEDARRRCDQCEDVFCDACYAKLHRSSKREKHTWKAIGSLRCIECEKMKATRWCYVCQDPYCLGCFTIIHSKGNKVNHEWTDMSSFRKAAKQQHAHAHQLAREEENAQTYNEFMQSNEYQYMTEFAVGESAPESYNQTATATTNYYDAGAAGTGEGEWMTLVDEASGMMYYYNAHTGESRWA